MVGVGICGHFAINQDFADGQTIKTRILKKELEKRVGYSNVKFLDTYGWKKKPVKLFKDLIILSRKCEKLIILPDQNGIKIILPLVVIMRFLDLKNIHYVVVGGWLPNLISNNKFLKVFAKSIECIHVETSTMKNALKKNGIENVDIMPNMKRLNILDKDSLFYEHTIPYKICTFSRVIKQKGIEDICSTIYKINSHYGKNIYELDVYGQIFDGYQQEFDSIVDKYKSCVKYKGIIDQNKSVEIIKNYFILAFPTLFKTEGIPGTIIDAYSSGVPILASKWDSCSDIIDNNKTGIVYKFSDKDDLYEKLVYIKENSNIILSMKNNCIDKASLYSVDNVIDRFIDKLNLEEI